MSQVLSDERLVDLAEKVLEQSPEVRENWLRNACRGDVQAISQVRAYIDSEIRIKHFLNLPFAQAMRGLLLHEFGAEAPTVIHFSVGEIVADRFRIIRCIAEGGMGVVYEAFDEKLRRRVAIKFARLGFGNHLPPEVRHASEITHPNVCRIFDMHTSSSPSGPAEFFSMEFLDGRTLADRLNDGSLDASSAISIALQLCQGLAAAHKQRVIHGDLKCNNVILVPAKDGVPERAVITDFGLARQARWTGVAGNLDAQRLASAPVGGVRAFMAPELLNGQKPTMASDIYATGVILRQVSLAARPGVPRQWNGIINRCLEMEPARRFINGEALLSALSPSATRRWIAAAAAVLFAASLSGMLTYQRANAPKRTVRLALLPFAGDSSSSLSHATAARLAQLNGNRQVRFEFLDRAAFATHTLRGTIETSPSSPQSAKTVHAFLTDAQTGVDKAEWRLRYQSADLPFAPTALAGLAAIALDLPPLQKDPDLNAAARNDYAAGLTMIRDEAQPDEALSRLNRAVYADPNSALAFAGLAEAQLLESRLHQDNAWLDQARESVRQAELRNPDLVEVHLISGWLDKTSGHYESAAKHFLRAIESQPADATAWRRLGQTYEAAGQEGEALDALRRAVAAEPGYFKNHRELGIFFYRRNRFPEAVKEFSAMATFAPNSPESHTLLGETWYQMSNYGNAESELQLAATLRDTSDTEHTLGAICWDEQKDEEAAGHYLRALQIGPENSSIWMSLGFCYREQKLAAKASNVYRRGLQASGKELVQDPRNARAHASQAYFEAMLHDPARAEEDAAESLKLSHDDDTTQFAVMTYEAIGRRDLALQVLETFPDVLNELRRYPWLASLRSAVNKGGTLQ